MPPMLNNNQMRAMRPGAAPGMPTAAGEMTAPGFTGSSVPGQVPQQAMQMNQMRTAPGTPNAPGQGPAGNAPMEQINSKYQDVLKGFDTDAAKNQGLLQNQMGSRLRESNVMANRMGGGMGVGGGFASMTSGANARGMNEMAKAQLASSDSRRGIMMKWMDDQLGESRRQEEHGWATTAADKAHANDLENTYMQAVINGDVTPTDAGKAAFMNGSYGSYVNSMKPPTQLQKSAMESGPSLFTRARQASAQHIETLKGITGTPDQQAAAKNAIGYTGNYSVDTNPSVATSSGRRRLTKPLR